MTTLKLLLNERDRCHEYRDGRVLVLSFRWDREKVQYVTERGQLLGSAWPTAIKQAESLAQERVKAAARKR